jgi:phosphopantothenoylcysteine synthetase/decarboxylase
MSHHRKGPLKRPLLVQVGDEVLHIELTKWEGMLVVAPLSAHYLAKLANGL